MDGSCLDSRLEWAAYFGQTAHESGNFCYTSEINKNNMYCDATNTQYLCVAGQKYYGRGPIQVKYYLLHVLLLIGIDNMREEV